MSLSKRNVQISFGLGVDTKTDPKQLASGKMTALENARFSTDKEIIKRPGNVGLSPNILTGGTISAGKSVEAFQNELTMTDGSNLYSYSESLSEWILKGATFNCALTTKNITRTTTNQNIADSAYYAAGNLTMYAFVDGGSGAGYTIIDNDTGVSLVANNFVFGSSANQCKCFYITGHFIVVFLVSGSPGHLWYEAIPVANITSPTQGLLSSTVSATTPCFDAEVVGANLCIVYNSAGTNTGVILMTPALTTTTTTIASNPLALNVTGDTSGNFWISMFDGPTTNRVRVAVLSPTLTSVLTLTTIDSITNAYALTGIVSGTTLTLYYEFLPSGGYDSHAIRFNTITITGSIGTGNNMVFGVGLSSKVFLYNGFNYMWVIYAGQLEPNSIATTVLTTIEPTYFLINNSGTQLPNAVVVAKLAPGDAAGYGYVDGSFYSMRGLLAEVTPVGAGSYIFPYILDTQTESTNGIFSYTTNVSACFFNFNQTPTKALIANNLHLSGGLVTMYDGVNVVEHNFNLFPENLLSSTGTTGGGIGPGSALVTSGQLQYVSVYEWLDNQGQLHQSAPSVPISVTVVGGSPVSFTGSTGIGLAAIVSVSSVSNLIVGQTIVDATSGATFPAGTFITEIDAVGLNLRVSQKATANRSTDTFETFDTNTISVVIPTLRLTQKPKVSIALYRTAVNGTVFYRTPSSAVALFYNNKGVDTLSISDTTPDEVLIGNNQLYTTGGEVEFSAMPATNIIFANSKNRIIGIPSENQNQWWFSVQAAQNIPIQFSEEFVNQFSQIIGSITGVAEMDDKLIFFGPTTKFYVLGNGPASNGSNNDYTNPTQIIGATGCANQASIVKTPNGIMYQSNQGIYLLDRSLQEQYIGAEVEAFNSLTVTASTQTPDTTQVEFQLNDGQRLVYDYLFNQWEVDQLQVEAIDATAFSQNMAYLQADGTVLQQMNNVFNDNSAFIPMGFTTGWMSFAGIEGFQRVYELDFTGTYFSPHTLTINVFTNYGTTPTQVAVIPVLTQPKLYQFRIRMKQQKCEAIQFQFIESQPSAPYGEGFSLSSMALIVGVKTGLHKLAATASY